MFYAQKIWNRLLSNLVKMETERILERIATVLRKDRYYVDVSVNNEDVNYFAVMKNGSGKFLKVRSLLILVKHDLGKIRKGRKITVYEPDIITEIKKMNRGQKITNRMNDNITYSDAVKIISKVTGGIINLSCQKNSDISTN